MKILFVASGNHNNSSGTVVGNQAASLTRSGLNITYFPVKNKGFFGYLINIHPLIKKLKNEHFDIVHSHYSFSGFLTTFALLGFHQGKPVHVVSLMGSDTMSKHPFKTLLISLFSLFWDMTIVKSQAMKDSIKVQRATIIPNGIDLRLIADIEDKIKRCRPRSSLDVKKYILFPADPDREAKNFSLAKNAAQTANRELKVVFNKSHQEIIEEIYNSSLVLLTSKWEGSPNIIKEAMACNRPIVATKVGDVEWLLGDVKGHYVTNFNKNDVAKKILQAFEYEDQYKNTQGRERIIHLELDDQQIANRLVTLYHRLLEKS